MKKVVDLAGVGSIAGVTGPLNSTRPIIGLARYQWNLPPHKWSMPVEPSKDPLAVDAGAYTHGGTHKFRRGRIYWYSRVGNNYVNRATYNDGSDLKDPRYGFQFMWNPEAITTSVAVNMDITPSFADKFVDVVGAFPSGQYLTLTVRLDRTNDFACIKSIPPGSSRNVTYDELARRYKKFYNGNDTLDNPSSAVLVGKIQDLQKLGTIADVEYLYKAINGPGWVNQATGRLSSDIGFLSPTLLKIDLGPLSYLGYVSNLAVNHIGFSKGMIPIRTDVSLQFNLMATAGLAAR
jgi:hypothetical protein